MIETFTDICDFIFINLGKAIEWIAVGMLIHIGWNLIG